jgi:hypothetical protein
MSYIGNQPQYTSFLSDTFSGNGITTSFNLRVAPANTAAVIIGISGVLQSPNDYSVVGNILTFSSPPPTGASNISVRYLSLPASNVVNSAYRSVTDITATAGQTTFSTSSYTPGFVEVFRNGVRLGISNYTATSGVTVVLGNPANSGDLITVVSFFVSSVINAIPGTAGSVTANHLDASQQGGAGAMIIPTGSTGQRPISPVVGMTRWNTSLNAMEVFVGGGVWQEIAGPSYSVEYLVVAGGGAGGMGGGGGGGFITDTTTVTPGSSFSITVGAGGIGGLTNATASTGGGSSSFGGVATAIGGGRGGWLNDNQANGNGGAGGSGGGAARTSTVQMIGGAGTAGQGTNGGSANTTNPYPSGGGGGAGSAGTSGSGSTHGGGGAGRSSSISGSSVGYCGGGGGGGNSNTAAAGGGSGAGNGSAGGAGSAGTANTGGGGGGSAEGSGLSGGNGGSGVVIIRYSNALGQRGVGGTVTNTGGFIIHTFTSSGIFTA